MVIMTPSDDTEKCPDDEMSLRGMIPSRVFSRRAINLVDPSIARHAHPTWIFRNLSACFARCAVLINQTINLQLLNVRTW